MSKIHYITDWEDWVKFCALEDMDPYENVDCSFDLGGGNTFDIEYIGDLPEDQKRAMLDITEEDRLERLRVCRCHCSLMSSDKKK